MSTDDEKMLDNLTRDALLKVGLETPPQSLLKNVMIKVGKNPLFVYKPLIGKPMWFFIALFLAVLPLMAIYLGIENSFFGRKVNKLPIAFEPTLKLPELSLSNTTLVVLVMAGVLVIMQVYFLKNWHKSRLKRLG